VTKHEFDKLFPTELDAIKYFIDIKRQQGVLKCPHCGETKKLHQDSIRPEVIRCPCKYSFSIFSNTIFFKSKTDLKKWFLAINMFLNAKKGISSLQLIRELKLSKKCAWRILKEIRLAMGNVEMKQLFEGIVEMDETYIGGKPRKRNKYQLIHNNFMQKEKTHFKRGRGTNKIPVVGVKERSTGKVYAKVMLPDEKGKKLSGDQLLSILDHSCKKDTTVMTDEFTGYKILDKYTDNNYKHYSVNHSQEEYSTGNGVHVNGIENFWSKLKRGIYGIYHRTSEKHLQKYVDEFCFRQNNLKNEQIFDTLHEQTILKKEKPEKVA
jgi:transposase-like protein